MPTTTQQVMPDKSQIMAKLAEYQSIINTLKPEIAKAERGGIDMSEVKSQMTTLENRVAQMKAAYSV